jgi:hypothetical protein
MHDSANKFTSGVLQSLFRDSSAPESVRVEGQGRPGLPGASLVSVTKFR